MPTTIADDLSVAVPSSARTAAFVAYGLGAAATVGGLVYAAVDQIVLGGLDDHLRELYAPVGKYGEAGPLYGYLYVIGVLGLVCWWLNLRLLGGGARKARRWGWATWAVAALPVLAPLVLREYGQPVIPLGLAAGYLVAWTCGAIGVVALGRSRRSGPQAHGVR